MDQYYEELVFNVCTTPVMEQLQGVDHFVIPAVGIREGVYSGSQGPILYPHSSISKTPSNWDHKPVVVQHPKKGNKPHTAADPEMINKYGTGLLLNTAVKDKKLTFKTWINSNRIKELSKKVYDKIQKKEKIEVSTGMLMDIERKKGVFNGRPYLGIAHNIQPDHLAILPDAVGACSIEDGAGLFACNEAGSRINPSELLKMLEVIDEGPRQDVLEIVNRWLVENEMSFTSIQRSLNDVLSQKYGEKGKYWNGYIREVFNDRAIFYDPSGKMYQVEYSIKDDEVVINGDRQEVQVVTQYQRVDNQSTETVENKKMANDAKRVAVVIATKGSGFTAEDKETLINMDEKVFEKVEKTVLAVNTAPEKVEEKEEPEEKPKGKKTKPTLEEYLKTLPPKMRRQVENGLKSEERERANYIRIIINAKGCQFKEESLKDEELFSTEQLQGMAVQIEALTKGKKVRNEEDDDDDDETFYAGTSVLKDDAEKEEDDDADDDEEEEEKSIARVGQGSVTNQRKSTVSMVPKQMDWAQIAATKK